MKFHIKKGDLVKVISGNSKGKEGKISKIFTKKNRATVSGLNIIKKHIKPSAKNPQGGIVNKESSLHISNLSLIDPKTKQITKVGRKKNANNKLQRFSKKTGDFI